MTRLVIIKTVTDILLLLTRSGFLPVLTDTTPYSKRSDKIVAKFES